MTSLTFYDGKAMVHCFNWLLVIFALGTMWTATHADNMFTSVSSMKNYVSTFTLDLMYYGCLASIIVSIVIGYINT